MPFSFLPSCGDIECYACLFAPAFSRLPFRACLFALISILALLSICASSCLADAFSWDANTQGSFITSLCRDIRGNVWIGTEDKGVYRLDPAASKDKQYTHFTTQDGLGDDNAYALVCDKAGRIWAGTLNHGVSVYNGKAWKTYGPLNGPLGSRVFALAVSPSDGGVWGATEAGLFRYENSHWTYFTRADGLPSDQANALAFASDGTLYVGTQCDGIAIASPADNYKSWRTIPGPKQMPNGATGYGLPSQLINCLLTTPGGTVYAGTSTGLAWSSDKGVTWRFRRGLDWKDKLAGLYPPARPLEQPVRGDLLQEDYVTSLADGGAGHLLIGHRHLGLEIINLIDGKRLYPGPKDKSPTDYVTALLSQPGGTALIGGYGGGLLQQSLPGIAAKPVPLTAIVSAPDGTPRFPASAKPPTLAELNAMLRVVSAVAPDKDELLPKVVALDDDWVTEGDWLGRYGRYWTCLCATSSPSNYVWGSGWELVRYALQNGPNRTNDDKLRYWIQWLYTQNPHVLELPAVYMDTRVLRKLTTWDNNRRESEVDDHGEVYPVAMDGPHVYCTLAVPNGLFTLSLYDVNYNGHGIWERSRDYHVSIRPHPPEKGIGDISGFAQQPEWAAGRIQNFWGGVYKRFLVRGPVQLNIEINRNHSFNTILPAAMLDLVDENPPPYTGTPEQRLVWRNNQRQLLLTQWQTKTAVQRFPSAHTETQAAAEVFEALQGLQFTNGTWRAVNGRRFYGSLLRWYAAQVKASATPDKSLQSNLGTCYYQSGLYDSWEQCQRQAGLTPARDIEKALRWDGTNGFGHGFEAVSDYLANGSPVAQKGEDARSPLSFQPGSVEVGGH